MTELSFSNTKNEFSSNLFSIFFKFCFSIFSHPLYFSYFIFFSPYLLKLFSFLSPLFITTTLLLVALLTFTPNLVHENGGSEFSESKWGFPLSFLQTFLTWLLSKPDDKDEEIGCLEELEAYLVMFQEVFEPKPVEDCSEGLKALDGECSGEEREDFYPIEESNVNSDENPFEEVDKVEAIVPIAEVKSLESLFQENAVLEDMSCQREEKEVKPLDAESNKVEESKEKWPLRNGSKALSNGDMYTKWNSDGEYAAALNVKSQRLCSDLGSPESNWEYSGKVMGNNQALCSNLGSFGSMRVEKEWRRTLACKLFEERHNADGSAGMDMLWETYETESNNKVQKKSNTKKGKKGEVQYNEDEEEEEEDMESKLCCLQALKFSAGKMNLGMGRPNLLKFSKALKGIGWLHHVGKHGRKSNH
ncbi:uncharacterized protein LOC133293717 [Gastrolobium bilobum]|uniref:uncharacterized protein LOC133293717 n=1 Tax=Gastrolobium bilobum TaxID=150636 RepID=UPI002AB1818C|nr:uncharacterized protein LOC133293717 [Gastrolobium bilobum]